MHSGLPPLKFKKARSIQKHIPEARQQLPQQQQ